ncbi:MAG TPA: molybdopterin converting factor subunit 1 [Burkholderiales bacterium]|nr:molybdopterin converting factor subunit 1 [Burkholderiales bacterium]
MKVKVLYFAALREQLGTAGEELELPAGVATVAALRSHLRGRGGAWERALAEGRLVRMAVNQDMAPPATAIRAGDEVAFFPPVTGG